MTSPLLHSLTLYDSKEHLISLYSAGTRGLCTWPSWVGSFQDSSSQVTFYGVHLGHKKHHISFLHPLLHSSLLPLDFCR